MRGRAGAFRQRGLVNCLPSRGRHEQDGRLAGIRIGASYRGRESDAGKVQRHVLDAGRVDIVTAADDYILGAAGNIDLPVGADATQIAAAQPALVQGGTGLPRIEITGKHLRPAAEDFAARRRRPAMNFAVGKNCDFGKRNRDATGADVLLAIMRRLCDGASEFGHSVDLADAFA